MSTFRTTYWWPQSSQTLTKSHGTVIFMKKWDPWLFFFKQHLTSVTLTIYEFVRCLTIYPCVASVGKDSPGWDWASVNSGPGTAAIRFRTTSGERYCKNICTACQLERGVYFMYIHIHYCSKLCERSLLCLQRLPLFDQKYSINCNIVNYY